MSTPIAQLLHGKDPEAVIAAAAHSTERAQRRHNAELATPSARFGIMTEAQLIVSLKHLRDDLKELRGEQHPKSWWEHLLNRLKHDRFTLAQWSVAEPYILRGPRPYRRDTQYSDFFPSRKLMEEQLGGNVVDMAYHREVVKSTYETARRDAEQELRTQYIDAERQSRQAAMDVWQREKDRMLIVELQTKVAALERTIHEQKIMIDAQHEALREYQDDVQLLEQQLRAADPTPVVASPEPSEDASAAPSKDASAQPSEGTPDVA